MNSMQDIMGRLNGARGQTGKGEPQTGRLVEIADFGPNPGALRALAYLPPGLAPGAPLVVVLHGCTQTAASYDEGAGWSALADEAGFALLFPEQRRANNANLCFNWFEPGDITREGGEARSIRSMIAHMTTAHRLDPARRFVTGLSAGGAMAAVMLATHPELFAGGAVIAGLPYASAGSVQEAFERMRGEGGPEAERLAARVRAASDHDGPWPSLAVWHGSADRTVAPSNADALAAAWAAVTGASSAPTQASQAGRHGTLSWMDGDGQVRIEQHLIDGMGHGTPVAANGAAGSGRAGPYMLDVGVASTRRIAAGWGIASHDAVETLSMDQAGDGGAATWARATGVPWPGLADAPAFRMGSSSAGINRTIEGALRAAGLLR